jgi:hypothetical protein
MQDFAARRAKRRAARLDPDKSQALVNQAVKGKEPAPPKKEPGPVDDSRRVGTQNGRPYTMGQARSAIDDAISGRSSGAGAHVADHPSEGPPPPARRGPSGEDTQRMVNDAVSGRSPASSYGPQRRRRLSQVSS